jgi:hypothetical protein
MKEVRVDMVKLDDKSLQLAMHERIVEVARAKDTIGYRKLAIAVGMDASSEHFAANVGRVLDSINEQEHARGNPLISAVVIGVDANGPGPGFFECAKKLNVYRGGDDLKYWIEELQRVHDYWSRQPK